jgi:ProQ/FINO family/Family of unknown function (DUF5906)
MTSDVVFQLSARHHLNSTIELLRDRFSAAFPAGDARVPLKINLHWDLEKRAPDISQLDQQMAFDFWCGTRPYLEAQVEGVVRVDLDGNPAGLVTADEAALARSMLRELDAVAVRIEIGRAGVPSGKRVIYWRDAAGGVLVMNQPLQTLSVVTATANFKYHDAIDFLERVRPGGPWVLTAIDPNSRGIETIPANTPTEIDHFVARFNGSWNIYFHINACFKPITSKAAKTDVGVVEFVHADVDPNPGESSDDAQARYLKAMETCDLARPSWIISSGNGLQAGWRLDKPLKLPPPVPGFDENGKPCLVLTSEAEAIIADVEKRSEAIMLKLGAKAGTQDISRLLRVPGTVNYPNEKKRKDHRVKCRARVIEFDGGTYPLESFPLPEKEAKVSAARLNPTMAVKATGASVSTKGPLDLNRLRVSERVMITIETGADPEKDPDKRWKGRSECVFACCLALAAQNHEDSVFESIFLDAKYLISAHVLDQPNKEKYLAKQIADAREQTIDPVVAEMNEKYALVLLGAKTAILKHQEPVLTLMTIEAFKEWNADWVVPALDSQGKWDGKKYEEATRRWRRSRQRLKYDGIVFEPGGAKPGFYNLFKGWAVKPKAGDWSLFRDHLFRNVAGGNEDLFKWVFGFFAQIIQKPQAKLGTSLVLRGDQGTGKSIVGEIFGHIIGSHYKLVDDPRYVTGQFNSHLVAVLLLQADEAFWAGDPQAEGKIKSLITSPTHLIELKRHEPVEAGNYIRLLVTSNNDWVIPAGMQERRFAVLDVGEANIQDHAYFAKIKNQMANGGYEALLHDMLEFDLASVDLRVIPKTDALRDQKIASMTDEEKWYLDLLHEGLLPWGHEEALCCPTSRLQESYNAHVKRRGAKARSIAVQLGIFLKKHLPELKKFDDFYNRWNARREEMDSIPGKIYRFPPLQECRAAFEKQMQESFPWPELGDDDQLYPERGEWRKQPPPDWDTPEALD